MSQPATSLLNQRSGEWRSRLGVLVAGLLVFETITGLGIYLLPFSLPVQFSVILHTAIGLGFLVPYLIYQVRHWLIYRGAAMTHVKLTGYLALASLAVCAVSGVALTFQSAFGTRISYGWDLVHIISTFALIAAAAPHVITLILRARRRALAEGGAVLVAAQRHWLTGTAVITVVLLAAVGVWTAAYEPVVFDNAFPDDYELAYGENRPFAPSLATTATGGAFEARSLAGSKTCGTAGCHEQIVAEWEVSAHRYAAMDVAFQKVQEVMAQQNGAASTRYCGGCHDPISLFSGTKNIFTEELTGLAGYQEGISCIACHSIKETDVKGNANYTIVQPERYAYELKEEDGAAAAFLRDFLIRSYPKHHVETFSHRLFKSPEFCAACHKQFIDAEINNVGWVQLQNQYDNWRKSRWNHPGDATRTIECRECHMPLISPSEEPGAGDVLDYNRSVDDGKHRSHRFLGANQVMPALLKLPGAEEHIALTEKWLRGEIEVLEIAHKWAEGPAVPIELVAPETVAPGEEILLRVIITNNKVGHEFPTGPLDIIQAWVEVVVEDDRGVSVYETGTLDEDHFIAPGSFMFKAEPVDQYGNLIDRHNLWEMVGVRFKRALFPGFADVAEFSFGCPGAVPGDPAGLEGEEEFRLPAPPSGAGTLHVTAKLQYRKVSQSLLNFLFGEDSGLTTPVTTISEATGTIRVLPASIGMAPQPAQGSLQPGS